MPEEKYKGKVQERKQKKQSYSVYSQWYIERTPIDGSMAACQG